MALDEQLLGNWIQANETRYIEIQLAPEGMWSSHVKIANPSSKIVAFKGEASGTWYVQEKQLTMTVAESTIEKVWGKNSIYSFAVEDILASRLVLKNAEGKEVQWEKETPDQKALEGTSPVLDMAPIAVNLNKISSNTKDSYLCVKISIVLKELMPGVPPPVIHPRIREAAIIFFSSLIHDQVKNFDEVNVQKEALVKVLNPYLDGGIKEIDLKKIMISPSYEKVEEFLMDFSQEPAPAAEE